MRIKNKKHNDKIKKEKENRKNMHFLWKRKKRMKKEKEMTTNNKSLSCAASIEKAWRGGDSNDMAEQKI